MAWLLSVTATGSGPGDGRTLALLGLIAAIAALVTLRQQGLYLARVSSHRVLEARGVARSATLAAVLFTAAEPLLGLRPHLPLAITYAAAAGVLLVLARGWYRTWLAARRRAGTYVRRLLVVGANEEAAEFLELIDDHPELGYRIAGVLGNAPPDFPCPRIGGRVEDAVDVARNLDVSGAVVVASALTAHQLRVVTRSLLGAGVHVHVSSGLSGFSRTRVRPISLAHQPLLYLEAASGLAGWQRALKRAMDISLSAMLLLVSLPLWLFIAICIKAESEGPVFFTQERVGWRGNPFRMVKFRTMSTDAEQRLDTLADENERADSPLFKMSTDPRVTRVGRFLRATSLDELPQLLNVLVGTMSLVGPRPAMLHEVESFDEELQNRVREKPGITGLWQVEARDHPSFGPYRRLDLFYVENWSLGLDLLILVGTVTAVGGRIMRFLFPFVRTETSVKPL